MTNKNFLSMERAIEIVKEWQNRQDLATEEDLVIMSAEAVLQSPEIQQLRKDAERYRWLRSDDSADIVDCIDYSGPLDGQVLDAAIDAAMEATNE